MKFPTTAGLQKYSRLMTLALVFALFVALVALYAARDSATQLRSSRVYTADGDSLRMKGERIRLLGIDAPELDQSCQSVDGASWPCGRVARDRLASLVRDANVTCSGTARDQYDRLLARCRVDGRDLGRAMVLEGFAVSYGDYQSEENLARTGNRGIWEGLFVRPRDWRNGERINQEVRNWWDNLFR